MFIYLTLYSKAVMWFCITHTDSYQVLLWDFSTMVSLSLITIVNF